MEFPLLYFCYLVLSCGGGAQMPCTTRTGRPAATILPDRTT
jgi:hypothetical protein